MKLAKVLQHGTLSSPRNETAVSIGPGDVIGGMMIPLARIELRRIRLQVWLQTSRPLQQIK